VIDFSLDPELELIRDTARQFATEELLPRHREFEGARGLPPEVQRRFAETGLALVELPESLGGAGLGALARVLVLEELGAADPGAALALDPLGPALYPLAVFGGEEALVRHAAPLLEQPGARAVLAFDPVPELSEEAGRVSGRLAYVPSDRIDLLVVLEKERAYVVREGLSLGPVRGAGLRAAGAAEVRAEGAPIEASFVNTPAARESLARARLYLAALLLGVLRAASEYARSYAVERVAFGRPIAHHQALAFLLMDMESAVAGVRALVHEAAWRLDQGLSAMLACATAFTEACEQAVFVGPNAVQVLGGHGFMQDYPVEKHMREARALSLLLGGPDAARDEAGSLLVRETGPIELGAREP